MINLSDLWLAIEGRVLQLIHKTEARGCRVYNSATQTVTAGANTALTWNVEVYDTDSCWDSGSPTHLTACRDGYYLAGGSIYLEAAQINADDRLALSVRRNGTDYLNLTDLHTINGQAATLAITAGMFWLSAGEYVEICVFNAFAADKTVAAATASINGYNCGWLMRVG